MRRAVVAVLGGGLAALILGLLLNAPANAKPLSEGGFLGVYTNEMDIAMLEALNYDGEGVLVEDVVKDSPADRADVKPGDILVKFDDKTIHSPRSLERALWRTEPGEEATLTLWRDQKERTVKVKLSDKPDEEPYAVFMRDGSFWKGDTLSFEMPKVGYLGIRMQDLGDQLADYFGAKEGGVLVESVEEDSPAESSGFKAGDVIVAMNKEAVDESSEVSEEVRDHKKGDKLTFTVLRDHKKKNLTATLDEKEGWGWFGSDMKPHMMKIIREIPRKIHVPRVDVRVSPDDYDRYYFRGDAK